MGPSAVFDTTRVLELAGEYRLTMRADSFPSVGATTVGVLSLQVQTDTLRRYYVRPVFAPGWVPSGDRALVGTLEIDLTPIAGSTSGDPASTDPDAPGVYYESRSPFFDYPRFEIGLFPGMLDGSLVILKPERMSSEGFGGRWVPEYGGVYMVTEAGDRAHVGGDFCAVRAGR